MGKIVKAAAGGAVMNYEEELARQAAIAAGMEESTATGQFFSTKGGVLAFNGSPIPGNELPVIVLDSILENVFYEGRYDPDQISGPKCFAFARTDDELVPHELVNEKQHDACTGCPQNEWGSADTGKGKACRNTRRLALIPAGTIDKNGAVVLEDDAEHFEKAGVAYIRLPLTSVKGYSAIVKQVAGVMRRPPHGVVMKMSLVPDPKTQFKIVFQPIEAVAKDILPIIMKRNTEQQALTAFPYQPMDEVAAAPAKKQGKPVRPAARQVRR